MGDGRIWEVRAKGVMQVADLAKRWEVLGGHSPAGVMLDQTRAAFALSAADMVRAINPLEAPGGPVALLVRPDTLPLYAVLSAHLTQRGFRRRVFLSRGDAVEWLARQIG